MEVSDLTGANLKARLSRMLVRTATSVDGRSAKDLKSMHTLIWDLLAELLQVVEDKGRWPARLAEGAEAVRLRPLSVLSTCCRLWAGLRLGDAMKWQELQIHSEVYGFRTNMSATDAAALLQTLVELARTTGKTVAGFILDYKKCFDFFPQRIALRLAKEFGMHSGVLRAAEVMYAPLRRAVDFSGCLSAWLRPPTAYCRGACSW